MILQLDLTKSQIKTLRLIVKEGIGSKIRLTYEQLTSHKGNDMLRLNKAQIKQICSATLNSKKKGADVYFSRDDLLSSADIPTIKISKFLPSIGMGHTTLNEIEDITNGTKKKKKSDAKISNVDRLINEYENLIQKKKA